MVDCCDNFATRQAVNAACVKHRKPLVSGAAIRFDGQISVYDTRDAKSPCYACLFPPSDDFEETRCATMGVFAPLVGIIGTMQAAEALKLLSGRRQVAGRAAADAGWPRDGMERGAGAAQPAACPVCRRPRGLPTAALPKDRKAGRAEPEHDPASCAARRRLSSRAFLGSAGRRRGSGRAATGRSRSRRGSREDRRASSLLPRGRRDIAAIRAAAYDDAASRKAGPQLASSPGTGFDGSRQRQQGIDGASASARPARPASAPLSGPTCGPANVPATFSGERRLRMLMSFG